MEGFARSLQRSFSRQRVECISPFLDQRQGRVLHELVSQVRNEPCLRSRAPSSCLLLAKLLALDNRHSGMAGIPLFSLGRPLHRSDSEAKPYKGEQPLQQQQRAYLQPYTNLRKAPTGRNLRSRLRTSQPPSAQTEPSPRDTWQRAFSRSFKQMKLRTKEGTRFPDLSRVS